MQLLNFLYALVTFLALLPSSSVAKPKKPKDAILLSSVKSLTLRANAKTSHRRVSAIPQLKCSGPGCKHYTVDIMRCTNQGADYNEEDVQWSCTANLPAEVKLGSTDVICEGYSNPDDEFVLKGSCGVEYRLLLTDKGEEKYGRFGGWGSSKKGDGEGWTFGSVLFTLVFLGVLGWILYSMYLAYQQTPGARRLPRRPGGFWGGGWGGGGGGGPGGGDPWDPPPPYPGKRSTTREEGWRPGFWSGAATGAAAGYAAGSRGQRQQEPPRQSSWFGGGDNNNNNWGNPTPRSSGSSSSSTARHESTGFGSTTRR